MVTPPQGVGSLLADLNQTGLCCSGGDGWWSWGRGGCVKALYPLSCFSQTFSSSIAISVLTHLKEKTQLFSFVLPPAPQCPLLLERIHDFWTEKSLQHQRDLSWSISTITVWCFKPLHSLQRSKRLKLDSKSHHGTFFFVKTVNKNLITAQNMKVYSLEELDVAVSSPFVIICLDEWLLQLRWTQTLNLQKERALPRSRARALTLKSALCTLIAHPETPSLCGRPPQWLSGCSTWESRRPAQQTDECICCFISTSSFLLLHSGWFLMTSSCFDTFFWIIFGQKNHFWLHLEKQTVNLFCHRSMNFEKLELKPCGYKTFFFTLFLRGGFLDYVSEKMDNYNERQ